MKFSVTYDKKSIDFDTNGAVPGCNSSPIIFQGHLSHFNVTRDKKYPILTRIERIWTVTPVWIRRWLLNDAQSLTESSVKFQDMQDKKSPILTRIEGFRTVTPDCNSRYALFNNYIYWITLGNKKVFWGATKFQMVLMKGIWTIKPSSLYFLLIWYLIFGQGNSQIME